MEITLDNSQVRPRKSTLKYGVDENHLSLAEIIRLTAEGNAKYWQWFVDSADCNRK
jgi:hypothetical protein